MKLHFLALTLAFLTLFSACTQSPAPAPASSPAPASVSFGCAVQDKVTEAIAEQVASSLQCSGVAAIKGDLVKATSALCSVPAPAEGKIKAQSVGTDICAGVAGLVVAGLASGTIPQSWSCTATNAQTLLKSAAQQGCAKIFP